MDKKKGQEKLRVDLEMMVSRAMQYLDIPHKEGPVFLLDSDMQMNLPINRAQLWSDVRFFLYEPEKPNYDQYFHSLRVGLYSVPLMDYFRVEDKQLRQDIFAAFLEHDRGKRKYIKLPVQDHGGKKYIDLLTKKPFTQEDYEKLKGHVSPKATGIIFNQRATQIAQDTHKHRNTDPYPAFTTQEIMYPDNSDESKVIRCWSTIEGIMDYADTALNRITSRTSPSFMDKCVGRKLPSRTTVKQELIQNYSSQEIFYHGKLFPPIEMYGYEFVKLMYKVGILGKGDPSNPFGEIKLAKPLNQSH